MESASNITPSCACRPWPSRMQADCPAQCREHFYIIRRHRLSLPVHTMEQPIIPSNSNIGNNDVLRRTSCTMAGPANKFKQNFETSRKGLPPTPYTKEGKQIIHLLRSPTYATKLLLFGIKYAIRNLYAAKFARARAPSLDIPSFANVVND